MTPTRVDTNLVSRRALIGGTLAGGIGLVLAPTHHARGQATPPSGWTLTIDLSGEPPTLDPALTYDVNGWSVVHSVYDALIQYGPDGHFQPLLAESLTLLDPLTYEIKLRRDVTFHNGESFDARSVAFSLAHLVADETASQVAGNFQVVTEVREIDSHTVRFILSEPAPWLPAQMAAWLLMLPPEYAADTANDFATRPVGTGPFRFVDWDPGDRIALEANPTYFRVSPKGQPLADMVEFRFVPEASTRVADLLSGGADLVVAVPVDQVAAVENGGEDVMSQALSGAAFVRIATDVEPFSDVRVRQALNYAVDVESIIDALLAGHGTRLASFYPDARGLGFAADLVPYRYDPERARALITEAGYPDGFDTKLEFATTERQELVEAVAGQLKAVGVKASLQPLETATFNQTWRDVDAAPLRFATWRPLFDPYTLLSLLVADEGFLSRHANPETQALIELAAAESDAGDREALYRDLGVLLHEQPAAVYLYNLTALYGVTADVAGWEPRADGSVIPTQTG